MTALIASATRSAEFLVRVRDALPDAGSLLETTAMLSVAGLMTAAVNMMF
ncbi:MAG TPA: hypothetical protein VEB20_18865 [Azospirillaceae bacterium]|nr:hypothetical protein [Azospirillaceae bacterium]